MKECLCTARLASTLGSLYVLINCDREDQDAGKSQENAERALEVNPSTSET
jgi:hypothetical protein